MGALVSFRVSALHDARVRATAHRAELPDSAMPPDRFVLVTTVVVLISFGLLTLPSPSNDTKLIALSALLGALLVSGSFASWRHPRAVQIAVPFGYLLLVALLREAEGGAQSGFAGLFVLPVILLALVGSPIELTGGIAAMALAQVVPLVAFGAPEYPASGWRGSLVLTSAAAVAGLMIQALLATTRQRAADSARWSRRLESLIEVGNALTTETDVDRLLELIADRLRDLLDARLVVVLLPSGTNGLRCAAAAGVDAAATLGRPVAPDQLDAVHGEGLWVPLAAYDRAIGVIGAWSRAGAFAVEDRRLTETFAARAAVAVDLSQRVARDAVLRVVAAQEAERRRLARELHDETGQTLTSILIGLKALEESAPPDAGRLVANLRSSVVGALKGVKRIVVELRPKALDDLGLVPALERLASGFADETGVAIRLEAQLTARLASEVETALYRIVQEGLTNVVKHANATNASVVLAAGDSRVLLVIEDDGAGFDLESGRKRGFGLEGMQERVQLLGGRLEIGSRRDGGTSLVVEVPLP